MDKSEVLNWLQDEKKKWEALLDEVGSERMEQAGVNGDWSMKDVVAHLAGWNQWLVARLQAALRGEPEPTPAWPSHLETDDEINAWIYESYRVRPFQNVREESQQTLQQLLTTIEALPDGIRIERVDPAFYLVWVGEKRFVASEFFNHYHDDHEPDVRAWLARVEGQ